MHWKKCLLDCTRNYSFFSKVCVGFCAMKFFHLFHFFLPTFPGLYLLKLMKSIFKKMKNKLFFSILLNQKNFYFKAKFLFLATTACTTFSIMMLFYFFMAFTIVKFKGTVECTIFDIFCDKNFFCNKIFLTGVKWYP